jgi:hypothetical protein
MWVATSPSIYALPALNLYFTAPCWFYDCSDPGTADNPIRQRSPNTRVASVLSLPRGRQRLFSHGHYVLVMGEIGDR